MFLTIFLFVVSVVLSILLRPKQPDQQAPALEGAQAPIAEVGVSIPVVYGKVMVEGPNVVWYGDPGYRAVKSSGGGK